MRNFDEWLLTMNETISSYGYYTDFNKVYLNVEKINIELYLMNSLLGKKKETIRQDFIDLGNKYPEIIKSIPLLIAVRKNEIKIYENENILYYNFYSMNKNIYQYADFLEKIGLLDLFSNHKISNLKDYMLGIEVGLDSNARKNRGGHLMEDLVENYIKKLNIPYNKEISAELLCEKYGIDLSPITNSGNSSKRFDFSFRYNGILYVIETNFYSSSGSKLNETARSYKMIAQEANSISNFEFIWITDGIGWNSARKNLRETFENLPTLFNLNDLKNNSLEKLINN